MIMIKKFSTGQTKFIQWILDNVDAKVFQASTKNLFSELLINGEYSTRFENHLNFIRLFFIDCYNSKSMVVPTRPQRVLLNYLNNKSFVMFNVAIGYSDYSKIGKRNSIYTIHILNESDVSVSWGTGSYDNTVSYEVHEIIENVKFGVWILV